MMRTDKSAWELPEWLRTNFAVIGAEGEDNDEGGNDDDSGSDSDDDGNDDDEDGSNNDDSGNDDDGSDEKDPVALRRALNRERQARKEAERARKAAERERTRLQREKDRKKSAEDDELGTTKEELTAAQQRVQKLADGFKKTALDRAIEKAARDAKFRDVDDALKLVDRSAITVDQDEDDPSDVDVDFDTVKAAVKKLASTKKHLISSGTEDDEPSGSRFSRRNRQKGPDGLEAKYRI